MCPPSCFVPYFGYSILHTVNSRQGHVRHICIGTRRQACRTQEHRDQVLGRLRIATFSLGHHDLRRVQHTNHDAGARRIGSLAKS